MPSAIAIDSRSGAIPYRMAGCPIRRSSDQCSVPAPRCFSQLPTSFFGTRRQGIHRMPLFLLALIPRLCNHRSGCSSHTITTPLHHSAKHGSVFRCHSVSLKQHLPAPTMRSAGSMHPSVGLVVCSLQLVRCKTRLTRETDLVLHPQARVQCSEHSPVSRRSSVV